MIKRFFGPAIFHCLISSLINAQAIIGYVTCEGRPVDDALVLVTDSVRVATTDQDGYFRIDGLDAGRYSLRIVHLQYEPFHDFIQLSSSKDLVLMIELSPGAIVLDEVTVRTFSPLETENIFRITEEETRRYPGTFFDPARFASSFPSMQVVNDQANQLAFRGLSPDFMQWNLEGVEILNPNHLSNAGTPGDRPTLTGGGVTMLSNQVLTNSNYRTPVRMGPAGNALGGLMDMNFRTGNPEKGEYTFQAGLLGIEAAAEGPIAKGGGSSYLVNYRYSTVGLITSLGVDFGDEQIQFQDLSFVLNFPAGKGSIKAFGLGGINSNKHDPLPMEEWEKDADFKAVEYKARGGTIGLAFRYPVFENALFELIPALSSNYYSRSEDWPTEINDDGDYDDEGTRSKISIKAAISGRTGLSGQWIFSVIYTRHWLDLYGMGSSTDINDFKISGTNNIFRPYLGYSGNLSRDLKLTAGVGYAFYSNSGTGVPEPELGLNWRAGEKLTFEARYRHTSQVLNDVIFTDLENGSNRDLKPSRAHIMEIAGNIELGKGLLQMELFYHRMPDLPSTAIPSDYSPLNLYGYPLQAIMNNEGSATSIGGSAAYRRNFYRGYFISTNVSVFRSRYTGSDGVERNLAFATGYTSYVGGGKEWYRNKEYGVRTWGLNASLVLQGGIRSAEIDLTESEKMLRTIYVPGSAGTVKAKDYNRVDLRVYLRKDKKKHSSTWSLDVQNLLNTENEWLPAYDFLLREVRIVKQLGIIPVLSYRIDF